jgi:hypothetical protein
LAELPDERMLAASAADDEDFCIAGHFGLSSVGARRGDVKREIGVRLVVAHSKIFHRNEHRGIA